MPEDRPKPFLAAETEFEDASFEVHPCLLRLASWNEDDWEASDACETFPLREIAPDAVDFLVEKGFLTQRDIKALVLLFHMEIDPKDHHAFYDRLLDKAEGEAWILPMIEVDVAQARLSKKRRRARHSGEDLGRVISKLPLHKLRLKNNPGLQERLPELVGEPPLSADIAVAAFFECAIQQYYNKIDNDEKCMGILYELLVGRSTLEEVAREFFKFCSEHGSWRSFGHFLARLYGDRNDLGLTEMDLLARTLEELGAVSNASRSTEDFRLVSDLAAIAAEAARALSGMDLKVVISGLAGLGVEVDEDSLAAESAETLREWWVWMLVSHAETLSVQAQKATAESDAAHAKVAEATAERQYDELPELALQATEAQEASDFSAAVLGEALDALRGVIAGRVVSREDIAAPLRTAAGLDDDRLEIDAYDEAEAGVHAEADEEEEGSGKSAEDSATAAIPVLSAEDVEEVAEDAIAATDSADAPVEENDAETAVDTSDDLEVEVPEKNELTDASVDATTDAVPAADEISAAPAEGATQEVEKAEPMRLPAVPGSALAELVRRDLMGIAAETAEAIERTGERWPVESRILRVAAASRIPHRDYGADSLEFADRTQQALSGVRSDADSILLFGATLIPAITQHDMAARQHLPDLCSGRLGKHLQEVADAITGLPYDFPPEPDVLAGLAGGLYTPRRARLAKSLAKWCEITRRKQSRWGFATQFMHHLASSSGPVGAANAAIMTGEKSANELVQSALEAIRDEAAIKDLSIEYAASAGRSARLHPRGIEYLDRHFGEARALLESWLAATTHGGAGGRGTGERFRSMVQNLVSRVEKARNSLAGIAKEGDGLEPALAAWIASRLGEALSVLKGDDVGRFPTIAEALAADRDLLPAGARRDLNSTDGDLRDLRSVLVQGGIAEPEDAFTRACKDGAFETATRLMERNRFDRLNQLRGAIATFVGEWCGVVEERERRLKTLAKLDYKSQEHIASWLTWCKTTLDRLREIEKGAEVEDLDELPGQVAETDALAEEIEARIREDQAQRIPNYRNGENTEAADALLDDLDALAIEAIEDRIAQLRDGQSVASFEIDLEGMVGAFTPRFVSATAGPDWPKSMSDYKAAIAGGGLLATEEDRRPTALALIQLYREITTSMKGGRPASAKIRQFFEDIGFENVRVSDLARIGRGKVWEMKLAGRITSDGWFLPPTFGSKAIGGYKVLLLGPDTLPEAIQKAVETEVPTILLAFGNAELARRHEFAERMRANAIPALFIDEALVAFAATRRETRARTIFECGLPYGRVEPYTTDAGRLPPEMFFGRDAEIRSIMSKSADGCLVYGGRQLGKSALLAHVARTRHSPEEKRIVKVLERKSLGDAEKISMIWSHLNAMLSEHGVVDKASRDAETVTRDIRAWLDENPGGQVVCMFDEADNFMTADTKKGYPELSELKSLMEVTGRAFKVVFAGLHNVKRMHRQPNSPLAHLGEPICIGPLNKNADDKRAAHDLVVDPMRAAGFRFENQEAVEEILAWANYYPSLVQEYAKGLLATLHGVGSGKSYRLPKDDPLWVIPTDELFSHRGFSLIEARVREKFQLTLNLDPRYALVAYTLAFRNAEGEEHKARISGFDATELLEYTKDFWPKTTELPTLAAFEVLLDELFDLGVLGRVVPPGTSRPAYVLRSRQVAAMLGTWEDIFQALQQLEEIDPTRHYDRTLYRRRYAPTERVSGMSQKNWPYAPLTDLQIEQLLDTRDSLSPVRIVCGLEMLGLGKVGQAMKRLADMDQLARDQAVSVVTVGSARELRRAIDRRTRGGKSVRVIIRRPTTAREAEDEISRLEQSGDLLDPARGILLLFVLDSADSDMREIAARRRELSELLRPWGEEMIRVHLDNMEYTVLDHRKLRQRILEQTGGVPSDIIELIQAIHNGDDTDAVFSVWASGVTLPEELIDGVLGSAIEVIEDADGPEAYSFVNELVREQTRNDLLTLGPDLVATGLLADWSAKRQRIRVSALGRMVRRHREA